MKLQERLPNHIKVGKRNVRVNLDFRNVLNMIDILAQKDLMPEAREWLALKCICRHPVKGMMPVVRKMLFAGAKENNEDRITDFVQDADLIRAAFLQEYGINLFREKLHWFEFSCLLSCIPEGSKYSSILSIRAKPMPEPNKYNEKERVWLANAKAEFALKLTEEEQQKKYNSDVKRLGDFLIALAGEGEKNV